MNNPYEYRRLAPTEHHACFVGGGECFIPASYATDDGSGTGVEVFMCPLHREEVEATEKIFRALPIEKIKQLQVLVDKASRSQKPPP